MKDFASPVELMKRALGFTVTVVPNGIIFVDRLSDSSNLVQSFWKCPELIHGCITDLSYLNEV